MANALDYMNWRGDLSFKAAPVNEVDRYIFACIGKPDFTGIIPADRSRVTVKEAAERYFAENPDVERLGLIASESTIPMLRKLPESVRFRDVEVSNFINKVSTEKTEQFSALTVHGPEGITYVSFRGTDDTIIAWRENFEMAVRDAIPAQLDAAEYLKKIAAQERGPLIVCGHSKGGNLAVFAAANAGERIQRRIEHVYNYDGPGFSEDFIKSEGYLRIKDKTTTVAPYKAIVSMLMNMPGSLEVVQTGNAGVVGHDGYTWDVERDSFIHSEELSPMSRIFRAAAAEELSEMDVNEKQELISELFDVLTSTGAFMLSDFTEQSLKQSLELANNFRKAPEIRRFLFRLTEESLKQAKEQLEARKLPEIKEKLEKVLPERHKKAEKDK